MLSRTICAYYSPMRQSRRRAATLRLFCYTQRLRCAEAQRRPTRPSLPCFPCKSTVPTPVVHRAFPLSLHGDSRFLDDYRVTNHTARLCQQYRQRSTPFRGCIICFMLRACVFAQPSWRLQRDEVICSSPHLMRCIITPAFTPSVARRRRDSG
jgi:hypothetical protein